MHMIKALLGRCLTRPLNLVGSQAGVDGLASVLEVAVYLGANVNELVKGAVLSLPKESWG